MRILLDTNVLLRAAQRKTQAGKSASHAIKTLHRQQHALYLTSQNIIEFWNVCTRPLGVNGLGISIAATERYVKKLRSVFPLIQESLQTFDKWHELVVQYGVIGAKVHDARLVAAMMVHGVTNILTFNARDFSRYKGITAINPDMVR